MISESLNKSKIQHFINPNSCRIEILDTINSTNTYLLKESDFTDTFACFTEHQTAGRGRHDKLWHCEKNQNLTFSLALFFPSATVLHGLSLAVGVMIVRALKKFNPKGLGLKWPNDVLANGKKLAGILIESVYQANGPIKVVIGIGLNTDSSPPQFTNLTELLGKRISRNQVAGLLLKQLLNDLPIFQQQGLSAFMADWQQYDACSVTNISACFAK